MKKIMMFLVSLFIGCLLGSVSVEGATNDQVLLVYDSLNLANEQGDTVDSLQRLLTSLGVEVDTVQEKDYLPGMLNTDAYAGVISLVNWAEKGLVSETLIKDRSRFTGKKLHIGMGLAADEEASFTGTFQELSHRQYTLIQQENVFQQSLPYQDQSLVLTTKSGEIFGKLKTQEVTEEEYPFGVIQGKNAFLPIYTNQGAVFLQSAELIQAWLGKNASYEPILTFRGFHPFYDMTLASDFIDELSQRSLNYIVSTTTVNTNNQLQAYEVFIDVLQKIQRSNLIFLSVPAVNGADVRDGRVLAPLLEEEISLLVSGDVYPVGLTAPGYWNQDQEYREDALAETKTLILEGNPAVDQQYYRRQDNRSETYDTAFYSIDGMALEGIEWLGEQGYPDYQFPMPTSLAYLFPSTQEEVTDTLKKLATSPFDFGKKYDSNYHFVVSTVTQEIQYQHGQLQLNGENVSRFMLHEETIVAKEAYQGLFAQLFRQLNNGLILFIAVVMIVIVILFISGARRYAAKYRQNGGRK